MLGEDGGELNTPINQSCPATEDTDIHQDFRNYLNNNNYNSFQELTEFVSPTMDLGGPALLQADEVMDTVSNLENNAQLLR